MERMENRSLILAPADLEKQIVASPNFMNTYELALARSSFSEFTADTDAWVRTAFSIRQKHKNSSEAALFSPSDFCVKNEQLTSLDLEAFLTYMRDTGYFEERVTDNGAVLFLPDHVQPVIEDIEAYAFKYHTRRIQEITAQFDSELGIRRR